MGFPDGWSDGDKYALLRALQENMTAFIYTEDERFAASVEAKIGKTTSEIVEAIRDLMQGLGFAIKSRSFHNEALSVDGEEIYPHKVLHDTMLAQPENRAGGVWDPDELRNALSKMRTYRHIFDGNPDLFFRRTQIWSKSVLDMRAKFYSWRELYLEESQKASEILMSGAKLERIRLLREIFENVPPAPPPTPSTPTSMASPVLGDEPPLGLRGRPPKSMKMRPWTEEDVELFVDLVVQLTLELQTKSESSLVSQIPVRLNRTTPSMMSKLLDIRSRLETKKSSLRAASLPKALFDPSTAAHKVFTSNWGDREDPFALGYHAIKVFHNRFLTTSKRDRPVLQRMETRQHTEAIRSNVSSNRSTPKRSTEKQQVLPEAKLSAALSIDSRPPRVPVSPPAQYSEFVRDCSTMLKKWSDARTYRVCIALLNALPFKDSLPRAELYERVAKEVGGVSRQEMWLSGERILRLCQKRYGSLACFAAAIQGHDTSTPAQDESRDEKLLEDDGAPVSNTVDPPVERTPLGPLQTDSPARSIATESPLSPPTPKPKRTFPVSVPAPTASYGKSNEAAMQILREKNSNADTTNIDATPVESSPSTHHFSPDHFDFDYDPGTPYEKEIEQEEEEEEEEEEEMKHIPAVHATPLADDEVGDEDMKLPRTRMVDAARKPNSSGRHHRHRTDPYHNRHHYGSSHASRAPGHMHVSSSKTLVIQKTPAYCHCDECEDRSRRRHRNFHLASHREGREEMRRTSLHSKRQLEEVYAYAATDSHYVHELAHKRIDRQHRRYESEEESEESDVSEDDMAAIEGIWGKLMAPIESDIQALEGKRREQLEREQDRLRKEQKCNWKQELVQQVQREWKPAPAANGVQVTASTENDA